jgi:hypothetical protein
MSSKEQFKDALKRRKQEQVSLQQENKDLKSKLALREKIIDEQRLQISLLRIELRRKRQWWKFWK